MDKLIGFKKSIQYIEDNLYKELHLEQAAHAGFTSLMQLYRDFYAFTGHSVKEYIRKRRLSNALSMIKFSDMSLTDIAYTCGYSSQQALCKYIKAATAMTALSYKDSQSFYYFPMYTGDTLRQVTVAEETIPQTVRVKYYHSQLRGIENRAMNALLSLLPEYNGRIFGRNGKQLGSQFCYELSVEYDPALLTKLKNTGFTEVSVLSETTWSFAKTTVKNDDDEIGQAWDYLYINWLRTSMFTKDERDYFEEYFLKDGRIKKLILYLPVKKRTDYNKISLNFFESMLFLVANRKGLKAEENASKAVITFLSEYDPSVIKNARQFYLAKNGMDCTCGIRLEKTLDLPHDSGLEILHIPEGSYAVLEANGCGEGSALETYLISWINENRHSKDNMPSFTIYETDINDESEAIKTKVMTRLKNVKNR